MGVGDSQVTQGHEIPRDVQVRSIGGIQSQIGGDPSLLSTSLDGAVGGYHVELPRSSFIQFWGLLLSCRALKHI